MLLLLLIGSIMSGGIAPLPFAPAASPTASAAAYAAATGASGADEEQPQSWLLKWRDPALAHELRGTEGLAARMRRRSCSYVRRAKMWTCKSG